MKFFCFEKLLLQQGWISPAYVTIDDAGIITQLGTVPLIESPYESVAGYAIPGFLNAHSHAFQYAMAGLAEKHQPGTQDDFWSWRDAMYRCALSVGPDELEAVAAMLYSEMLRNGYTHVAEFHYLHHDKAGRRYNNYAEMGERLIAAAASAGIKITLIPIFYQKGNFGKASSDQQRRFMSSDVDDYLQLLDDSASAVMRYKNASLGVGVHSLRAVDHSDIIKTFEQGPPSLAFHLHAAEQLKEVEDCLAHLKQRPVEWILNNMPVDSRFNIVHCTHMNEDETNRLAKSGATAILCPGTEGNLGDGIFRLTEYSARSGSWAIGTDSHISLNPIEDIRWLDYAQRFTTHRRNTFDDGAMHMISQVYRGGNLAVRSRTAEDFFAVGLPLDAVVYDSHAPLLLNQRSSNPLSSIVYTGDSSYVLGTLVDGKWIVEKNIHSNKESLIAAYKRAIASLTR